MNGLQMKYFVLNPLKENAYGKASRKAISQYARSIRKENGQLADDLERWIAELNLKMSKTFLSGDRNTR